MAVASLALALDAREAQAGAVDADGAPEYAGLGRRWDPVAAAEWLERAAAQGHPDAWFQARPLPFPLRVPLPYQPLRGSKDELSPAPPPLKPFSQRTHLHRQALGARASSGTPPLTPARRCRRSA